MRRCSGGLTGSNFNIFSHEKKLKSILIKTVYLNLTIINVECFETNFVLGYKSYKIFS